MATLEYLPNNEIKMKIGMSRVYYTIGANFVVCLDMLYPNPCAGNFSDSNEKLLLSKINIRLYMLKNIKIRAETALDNYVKLFR